MAISKDTLKTNKKQNYNSVKFDPHAQLSRAVGVQV